MMCQPPAAKRRGWQLHAG